jgi:epoxide hydrolase-like predicted phosphatase
MIKAIVFDFGGVVVDCTGQDIEKFVSEALNLSLQVVESTLFSVGGELIEGRISDESFWKNYAELIEKPLPMQWESLLKEFLIQRAVINLEMVKILKALKKRGFLLPLLSNIAPFQAEIFRKLGYFDHFSHLILSCEVGLKKPDPKFFKYLLDRIDLQPQECLFVDDEKPNVIAAMDLEMHAIQYQTVQELQHQLKIKL